MADSTGPVFRAVITAVDHATAVLDRVGHRIATLGEEGRRQARGIWTMQAAEAGRFARMSEHFVRARESLAVFGEGVRHAVEPWREMREPIHRVIEATHTLGEGFSRVREMVTDILTPIAALGSLGSVAGVFELVHGVAEKAGEIDQTAAALGMTHREVERLQYVAKQTDAPIDSLTHGIGRLGRSIGAAAGGRNRDAAALFAHLHIPLRGANGQLRTASQMLPQLADAFRHTTNATMRQRMAFTLFGRAGLDMLGFMTKGGDELDDLGTRFDALAYRFSGEDREHLENYKRSWVDLGTVVGAFTNQLGAELAPVLTPVIDGMRDWIAANRGWVATEITDRVRSLRDWLVSLDWHDLGERAKGYLRVIEVQMDRWGGLKTAILAVIAVITGPWIAAALSIVVDLGRITKAVIALSWAFGRTLVASIYAALATLIVFDRVAMRLPVFKTLSLLMSAANLLPGNSPVPVRPGSFLDRNVPPYDPEADKKRSWWTLPFDPARDWNGVRRWLGLGGDAAPAAAPPPMPPIPGEARGDGPAATTLPALPSPPDTGAPPAARARPDDRGRSPLAGALALTLLWTEYAQQQAQARDDDPLAGAIPAGALAAQGIPSPAGFGALLGQALGTAGRDGRVDVHVTFDNAPPGTRADADSSGAVDVHLPNIGLAMPSTGPAATSQANPLLGPLTPR